MPDVIVERIETAAYRIPTATPEADGTYTWDATVLVTVHATGGRACGFGYTYGSPAAVVLVRDQLAPRVVGLDALAVERAWLAMSAEVRNVGRPGIAATAISAIDGALWDLAAKLLGVPLVRLLGDARDAVPVYGSGGFTNYDLDELRDQLAGWARSGITRVKMKVGADPAADVARVAAARAAVGRGVELMVDANGAYHASDAIGKARAFGEHAVSWFEEPVSSDDLASLRFVRDHAPPGMAIAAGEYGYDPIYFRRMLEVGAVDVLQADATRCAGITGFLAAARLCQAFGIPLSTHTAPSLHLHPACAVPVLHLEYFHDHVRIEQMLFDGFVEQRGGMVRPDRSRPGLGVELKRADAEKYAL